MRLQELKKKELPEVDEAIGKTTLILLQSSLYYLNGDWLWDMNTREVFCSDVMISLPGDFTGTRAIFHPDDVDAVRTQLSTAGRQLGNISFRIITTYGEVKFLEGKNILVEKEPDGFAQWQQKKLQAIEDDQELKKQRNHLQLLHQVNLNTESFTRAGTWYYNISTVETWYSDFIFNLHGLPPQSLNAHLLTFHEFIHPEDVEAYTEFTDKAFQEKVPLQMEYRIITATGEKHVAYRSKWIFSEKGEYIWCGILQDITDQKAADIEIKASKDLVQLQKQQLAFDEQYANIGHWQIDLLTRKTIYSDNYYRIFGMKPATLAPTIQSFVEFVHPEDQDALTEAYKRLLNEHDLPDLEFRIIRADGKTRYISQRAKMIRSERELIISGIIQDITVQRQLEKKVTELNEKAVQRSLLQLQADEIGNTAGWVMDMETEALSWSDSMYKLLGYKATANNMSQKLFNSLIYPQDLNGFKDSWNQVLHQKQEVSFRFRVMSKGTVRHLKALFRVHRQGEKQYFIGTVQDITAEFILEQQLAQRIQLAENLTENIPDRVMITDMNNSVVLWNRACEDAYSIKKSEAIGQNFFDLFPHLMTEDELQIIQNAQRGEKIFQEGIASITGTSYYNKLIIPLYQQSEITGILHVIQDVTREMELRNSLNERLAFIERLLETSVDRIIALDRNLNYLYWNNKAAAYYKLPKRKVIGKNILDIFPQLRNDPSFTEFRRALKGETIHIPADVQKDKYFETYLIPIRSDKDQVTGILWVAHDLSKELEWIKQEQEVQQRLEQEHRRMLEAQAIGHIGSFEWDAASDKIYWSDELYRIHGLEPQSEVLNLDRAISFVHPDDKALVKDHISHWRSQATTVQFDHRIIRADGEVRNVRRRVQSFANGEGGVLHLIGTVQDITEQKKIEEQFEEQSHFLRRIVETVPDMVSVMRLPSRKLYYLNDERFAANGFDTGEMDTKSQEELSKMIHPEDMGALNTYFQKLSNTSDNEIVTTEYRAKDNTGEWKWFNVRGKVFQRDADGQVTQILNVIENITGRKVVEEELNHNKTFIEEITKTTPDLITIHDAESNRIIYSNHHGFWKGAYNTDEIYQMADQERAVAMILSDDVEKAKTFLDERRKLKEKEVKEAELRMKAGGWIRIRSKVFKRDEEGNALQIISFTSDITEAKKAAAELEKHLAVLQQAEELALMGSWEYDLASGHLNWSEGMYKLFDLPVGMTIKPEIYLEHAVTEDRDIAKSIIKNIKKLHQSFEETMQIKTRKGIHLLKIKGTVETNEKGHPVRFVGVDMDITDVKEAEEKLQESKRWLAQTTRISPDAIVVYDLQKKTPFYLNNCLAKWVGSTNEELLAMGIEGRLKLLHPDDRLAILHFNEKIAMLKDDVVLTIDYRLMKKEGDTRWIRNRSKIFQRNAEGKVTHILSLLQDITEEKMAEKLLKSLNESLERKNQELESKNEEITSFAFVASHDLKEPLRKIHTFSDWLLSKEKQLSEEGKENLVRLSHSAKRLGTLVEDILELTQVHTHKKDRKEVSLDTVLQQAKQELSAKIDSSGAIIHSETLPMIMGMENQLVYLFRHLLSNSIKFQPPDQRPEVHISVKKEESYLKISFADNGIGFNPQYSKKVFQMFRRLHGSTEYKGTGMGLAICRKIMEKHDGHITAESQPGQGATFTCWFPV